FIFSLCYLFRNPFSSTTIGDLNPIRTLGNYSKPSYEGYMNTIELSVGNNVTHLTLTVKIGKEHACVYFNFPFAIKLATGLNVFQQDPSPHRRILLPDSLLNSFHREGLQNSAMIS
ncbi:hypothetical protein Tco_0249532, partial [Tanacetum coccineum]